MIKTIIQGYEVYFNKNNTRIIDSYKIVDLEMDYVIQELVSFRKENNLLVTRTNESYRNEIIAHNRLYKLGLFKSHTKDVDLEEPISKCKEKMYGLFRK